MSARDSHPDGKEPGWARFEGPDLSPGNALKWRPCECDRPVCPEYRPATGSTQRLNARVAEANRRSQGTAQ